jgi:hypothetical protein
MTNVERKNIVRKAKKQIDWNNSNEVDQDKIVEKICKEKGFTLVEFYATDGVYLNKILS